MDWKDALSALADELPAGNEPETPAVTPPAAPRKQRLTMVYEKKGRKGKPATIIEGFDMEDEEISALLSKMQKRLGVGGSARGGEMLLQGDCRERAAAFLRELGHDVRY